MKLSEIRNILEAFNPDVDTTAFDNDLETVVDDVEFEFNEVDFISSYQSEFMETDDHFSVDGLKQSIKHYTEEDVSDRMAELGHDGSYGDLSGLRDTLTKKIVSELRRKGFKAT